MVNVYVRGQKTLTLKTPSLHWNKCESGAKEVNVFVFS